jgi:hypothetical protein
VQEATSRAIAGAIAGGERTAAVTRIARLVAPQARTRGRRLVLAVAALAALGVGVALVVEAVAYHETYEDRMTAERSHGK